MKQREKTSEETYCLGGRSTLARSSLHNTNKFKALMDVNFSDQLFFATNRSEMKDQVERWDHL